jgi:hypothetical protein
LGTFLALTGERIKGPELMGLALATHYIASKEDQETVKNTLKFDFGPTELTLRQRDNIVDDHLTMMEDEVDETNEEFLETVEFIFGAKAANDTVEGMLQRLVVRTTIISVVIVIIYNRIVYSEI